MGKELKIENYLEIADKPLRRHLESLTIREVQIKSHTHSNVERGPLLH